MIPGFIWKNGIAEEHLTRGVVQWHLVCTPNPGAADRLRVNFVEVMIHALGRQLPRLIRGEMEGLYCEEQNCFQVWTGEPRWTTQDLVHFTD